MATCIEQRSMMRWLEDRACINPCGGRDAKRRQADIFLRSHWSKVIISLKDLQFVNICHPCRNLPLELSKRKLLEKLTQVDQIFWFTSSILFPSFCYVPLNSDWVSCSFLTFLESRQNSCLGLVGQGLGAVLTGSVTLKISQDLILFTSLIIRYSCLFTLWNRSHIQNISKNNGVGNT